MQLGLHRYHDKPQPNYDGRWKQPRLWHGSLAMCGLMTILNIMILEILFAHFFETSIVIAETHNDRPIFNSKSGQFTTLQRKISQEDLVSISRGAEIFGLDFFSKISDEHLALPYQSFMISPYAVWSLLLMLTEGADRKTLAELRRTLAISNDQSVVRSAYQHITRYLMVNTSTIKVGTYQGLFTDINKPVHRDFEYTIEQDYNSQLVAVDFQDINSTYTKINDYINSATNGLIPHTVNPQDFIDPHLIMISSLYFKGQWRYQFDPKKTHEALFYDESGKIIGNVPMMTNTADYVYTSIPKLEAFVLELPYGRENRLSMLVILPKRGISVHKVVHNLKVLGIRPILQQLQNVSQYFEGEEIEVHLPSFTTTSHFSLRPILVKMGIKDIFDENYANLQKISQNIFVSSIFHATRIIVNEEGTEAAAVVQATLTNKSIPPKFHINRPFLYIILEKTTNLLLFAGQIKSNQ